jgi:hypothetical protein
MNTPQTSVAGTAIRSRAFALLVAVVAWYPRLKLLLPALPVLVLAVPTRSLANYFLFAVPGLLVAALTVRTSGTPLGGRARRVAAATVVVGLEAAALALAAVLTPAPLALAVRAEHTTGQLQGIDALTVEARNLTGRPLAPHFAVALGPYMSSFWLIHAGPAVLGSGASAEYELWAPNTGSMPSIEASTVLYAFTSSPAAMTVAQLPPPASLHAQISPQAVDAIVGSPPQVTFRVQVVDQLNHPVQRAGIIVDLGQVLYTSDGLFPGETSINGHPEGQAPVGAPTDAGGVATFSVRAIQQQPYEVFFQAWISDPYPHGYSNLVSVRFRL